MRFETATPRIASYVLVRQNHKIAFVLRAKTTWMNDHYGLPSGKVEKGETYTKAAIREAQEEIGISIKPSDLEVVHIMHRYEGSDWVDVFFEARAWEGKPINNEPTLHSNLDWLDPKKLPDNVIPSVRFAIEQIQKGKFFSEYGW